MDENKIALLVDIENVSPYAIEHVIDDLSQKGVICIKRAYCVADKLKDDSIEKVIKNNNLEIRTQYNIVDEKNVSDFNLVIDALEILYTKDINCFAIVSSDSDFNILVTKLKGENKMVIGYGEQKTKPEYRNNYNDFIFVENLSTNSEKAKNELIKESQVKSKDDLEKEIYSMVDSNDTECIALSYLKEKLCKKYPDFDERTYGYNKFSNFIRSMKSLKSDNQNVHIAKMTKNSKNESKAKKINNLNELKEALIKIVRKNNNKVNLGQINDLVKKEYPSFTLKSFGYSRFKTLIEKSKWKEIGFDRQKNPTSIVLK